MQDPKRQEEAYPLLDNLPEGCLDLSTRRTDFYPLTLLTRWVHQPLRGTSCIVFEGYQVPAALSLRGTSSCPLSSMTTAVFILGAVLLSVYIDDEVCIICVCICMCVCVCGMRVCVCVACVCVCVACVVCACDVENNGS